MEIEHEERPCVLDTLAERLDISEVLTNGRIRSSSMVFLRGVDKDPDTEGIPSAVVGQKSNQIRDIIAIDVFVRRVMFLIQGQGRDVSADIALRCFLRLRTEASEGAKE
jgi:hypothetical protein